MDNDGGIGILILDEKQMRSASGRVNQLSYEFYTADSIEYMNLRKEELLDMLEDVKRYKTKKILESESKGGVMCEK